MRRYLHNFAWPSLGSRRDPAVMADPTHILPDQSIAEQLANLETEISVLRQELDHSNRLASLGLLAAGIAHEINNVLTPVLAYAQLASANPADQQLQAKAIEKTMHGVQVAAQIAQAMLGFASNSHQENRARVCDVLDAALNTIGRDPNKDGIRMEIRINPADEVQMRPLALQQVLMNLILNACAAMKGKGGRLRISSTPQHHDRRTVIEVSDTGPGIPREIAGRLFEPFVSGSGSGSGRAGANIVRGADGTSDASAWASGRKSQHGSGLGLSICRRLVEEAGGTISASSPPGHGTTFTITLPTATSAAKAKAV